MSLDIAPGRTCWHVLGRKADGTTVAVCGAKLPDVKPWHDPTEAVFDMGMCGNCRRVVEPLS
jgi:hypothetical protein